MAIKDRRGAISADVQCPFYHRHDSNRIICDGLARGSTISMHFKSPERREAYMWQHCMDVKTCAFCGLYGALQDAYRGKGHEKQ